jgi:hypothetical protein
MRGLIRASMLTGANRERSMDCRVKPGNDGEEVRAASCSTGSAKFTASAAALTRLAQNQVDRKFLQ